MMSRPAIIMSSVSSAQSKRTLEIICAGSIQDRLIHKSTEEAGLGGDERDFAKAIVLAEGKDGLG